jgi:hypothetical protein
MSEVKGAQCWMEQSWQWSTQVHHVGRHTCSKHTMTMRHATGGVHADQPIVNESNRWLQSVGVTLLVQLLVKV